MNAAPHSTFAPSSLPRWRDCLGSSPFMHMPHVLETARAELLDAQAELHTLRVKSGVGKIKKGGMLIQHATRRLYTALDAVKAAQELHS